MVVSAAVVSAAAATLACGSSSSGSSGSSGSIEAGSSNNPGLPPCPATPPSVGAACSSSRTCTYDGGVVTNACGTLYLETTAQCTNGTWQILGTAVPSCNPGLPPPDAGDAGDASDDGGDSG